MDSKITIYEELQKQKRTLKNCKQAYNQS